MFIYIDYCFKNTFLFLFFKFEQNIKLIFQGIGVSPQESDIIAEDEEKKEILKQKIRKETSKIFDKYLNSSNSTKPNPTEIFKKCSEKLHNEKHRTEKELINLFEGQKYLMSQIKFIDEDKKVDHLHLLELKLIKETHKIVMKDVLESAGTFYTGKHHGSFKGEKFQYPQFKDDEIAAEAIDALVNNYNTTVGVWKRKLKDLSKENITSQNKEEEEKEYLENIFRSAAKFLFTFLQLHPFQDGNGRLGRILCSYFLRLFCPFPSSIYNVYSPTERSDYVTVLVNAREGLNFDKEIKSKEEAIEFVGKVFGQDESDLASLIIESNWFAWKEFMKNKEKPPEKKIKCEIF